MAGPTWHVRAVQRMIGGHLPLGGITLQIQRTPPRRSENLFSPNPLFGKCGAISAERPCLTAGGETLYRTRTLFLGRSNGNEGKPKPLVARNDGKRGEHRLVRPKYQSMKASNKEHFVHSLFKPFSSAKRQAGEDQIRKAPGDLQMLRYEDRSTLHTSFVELGPGCFYEMGDRERPTFARLGQN